MRLTELLETHDALARELAGFLSPAERLPLLILCRASVQSVVRRDLFAETRWTLPPERWLAERLVRDFTMKAVVTSVVVTDGEWQQHLLREFPALKVVEVHTLRSHADTQELAPQHFPLDQVTALDLTESKMGDMAALTGFKALEKLEMSMEVPAWNTHALGELTTLTSLSFGSSKDGFVDLSVVEKLPNLRELEIRDMEVGNMQPIEQLKQLETLNIPGCSIHDLAPLMAVAPTLKSFDASETRCSSWRVRPDDRAAFLSSLVNLRDLQLHDSMLTQDIGLAPLASLVNLTFLELSGDALDDLSPLASLTALETLVVRGTRDVDWSPISSLTKLKELDQQSSSVVVDTNPSAARVLAQLPLLERLSNPAALSTQHPLPQVRSLTVSGPSRYTPAISNVQVALDVCCPNVVSLRLNGCIDLKSLGLMRLPKLRELTMVQMDTKGVEFDGPRRDLIDYSPVATLRNLTSLSLSQVSKARDYGFLDALTNLRKLNMVHQSIKDISALGNMTEMRDLVISHAPITDVTVLGNLRKLELLFMDGTNVTDVSVLRGLPHLATLMLPTRADCSPLVDDYGVSLPSIKSLSHNGDCLWKDHADMRQPTIVCLDANGTPSQVRPPAPLFAKRVKYHI